MYYQTFQSQPPAAFVGLLEAFHGEIYKERVDGLRTEFGEGSVNNRAALVRNPAFLHFLLHRGYRPVDLVLIQSLRNAELVEFNADTVFFYHLQRVV